MISNKVKRNIWFVLGILSLAATIDRSIRLAAGKIEWWEVCSAAVITVCCLKCYLSYRKEVKTGNLAAKVNPFR